MNVLIVTINISLVDPTIQVSYSIPMRLPFRKNTFFTGRDQELAAIHETLYCPDGPLSDQRIMVLHGLGGIGKTQIAVQYAYIHQKDYTSVWWVNASSDAITSLERWVFDHSGI